MRQRMSERNGKKLAKKIGLDVDRLSHVTVRGGTEHRKDFHMKDGSCIYWYPPFTPTEATR